jgi:hypothetical protein
MKPATRQNNESDSISIEDARQFLADVKKKRENWELVAARSWAEIKKRNKKNRLWGGQDLDRQRRWVRYPLWWSCFEIRKPIVLSRLPIPICKDTQGDDDLGRTVCVISERFIKGILKTFDALPVFYTGRDDFLVTNFGWIRAFYKAEEHEEPEKMRVQMLPPMPPMDENGQPILDEQGQPLPPDPNQPPLFMAENGQPVQDPLEDEEGFYVLTGSEITITDEMVYLDHGLYTDLYVDPNIRRWSKCKKLAFAYEYTYRDFKAQFGEKALATLVQDTIDEHKNGKPIIVYEYWDYFTREVKWFAENSEDFFQPATMIPLGEEAREVEPRGEESLSEGESADEERADSSDIYGLSDFFPCVEPLLLNAPTDEFWPVPEFFQVQDMLEDVHNIVSRMFLLTKAIRVRFLFDGSVPELAALVGETGEGGGLSVPNLSQVLLNGKGTLAQLVAYFPVAEMIEGLQNMYQAFQQRLDMIFQATGMNDLIRGQTSEGDKTLGERQLEGKYAMNRIAPYQEAIQIWIKRNYELLMEMGFKTFSDESIDQYITPQTLDEDDRRKYTAALELAKSNRKKRFRLDFETDSTIAINEQYQRAAATELANTLTKAMESVAKVAETMPELAATELAVLKHLIGQFSDGKLFIDEITKSIEEVIEKTKQPKPEAPDPAMMRVQVDQQRLQLDAQKMTADQQFQQLQLQATQQLEFAKIQQADRISAIESELAQFKLGSEQQLQQMKMANDANIANEELEQQYQKIGAEVALAQQELSLKRDELLVELRKIADKKEVDQFALMIDERVAGFEAQLEAAKLELEKQHSGLELQERFITEQRLQAEHQLQLGHSKIESLEKIVDIALKKKELDAPLEVKQPETPKSKKRVSKVKRDKNGDIAEIVSEED